jgi:hypothetical protein
MRLTPCFASGFLFFSLCKRRCVCSNKVKDDFQNVESREINNGNTPKSKSMPLTNSPIINNFAPFPSGT